MSSTAGRFGVSGKGSTIAAGDIAVSLFRQALTVPNMVWNDLANCGELVWTGSGAKVVAV